MAWLKTLITAMAHTERGELVLVVVVGGIGADLVGHTSAVGDAGALLGQRQGGTLGVGEHGGLEPRRDQVQARSRSPRPWACRMSQVLD